MRAAVASDEASLVAILYRPVEPGQHRDGHGRKEQEIAEIFAGLSVERARTLHRRLSIAAAGDPLVTAFARLIPERRARLLSFLGDARRCAALRAA